ncbi:MAG: malonyl-ACP O-methyltransferase BioC [Ichthyobacteriaceae bacterium]|nr:malonyl-ACP O-methyltransferase BioC [Ichthyobacteriaceae bacterium]
MNKKELIKNRFSKNYDTYNIEAKVQKIMAEKLVDYLIKFCGIEHSNILEIGCGTGFVSNQVAEKLKTTNVISNDITNNYADVIANCYTGVKSFEFIDADAENLPDLKHKLNLVISGSTFQWFNNFQSTLSKYSNMLAEDGFLVFSIFGEKNFKEIKKVTGLGLKYKTMEEIENVLENDYEILFSSETIQTLRFPSSFEVLKHMKKTGVNALLSGDKKFSFAKFEKEYSEYFKNKEGVSLTYHPMYFIAKRK